MTRLSFLSFAFSRPTRLWYSQVQPLLLLLLLYFKCIPSLESWFSDAGTNPRTTVAVAKILFNQRHNCARPFAPFFLGQSDDGICQSNKETNILCLCVWHFILRHGAERNPLIPSARRRRRRRRRRRGERGREKYASYYTATTYKWVVGPLPLSTWRHVYKKITRRIV